MAVITQVNLYLLAKLFQVHQTLDFRKWESVNLSSFIQIRSLIPDLDPVHLNLQIMNFMVIIVRQFMALPTNIFNLINFNLLSFQY
jgi:hypothetical protein